MCMCFTCIYKCICIPTKGIFCFSWNTPSRLFSLGAIRTKILKGTHCLLGLIDWKASPSQARFENNKSFKYQKDSVITSIVIESHLFPYLIDICLQSNFPHIYGPVLIHHTIWLSHGSGGQAALVELRGDWKFLREAFALRTHWSAKDCCHLCTARCPADPIRRNRCPID